jgi:hypothetical protein
MTFLETSLSTLGATIKDVVPVIVLLVVFQLVIIRRPLPNWRKVVFGFAFVVLGLALFLDGLETALFPVGRIMALQLSAPDFIFGAETAPPEAPWYEYGWVYLFAALIGFATTVAEPALIAVSFKAQEVSRGGLNQWTLRLAVAFGVALGIGIGTFRIVTGTTLSFYILVGYVIVVMQTVWAPREIIPLAYDSGGVTTSTVTVPLVTALGLGLSENIPGRDPALDGFGLIAFASVFPMMTVLGYAQFVQWRQQRRSRAKKGDSQ